MTSISHYAAFKKVKTDDEMKKATKCCSRSLQTRITSKLTVWFENFMLKGIPADIALEKVIGTKGITPVQPRLPKFQPCA